MRGLAVMLFALCACQPLALFMPDPLPKDTPRILHASGRFPSGDVQIVLDDLAIPHIYANDERDLAYGLGVMHGRDRSFEILLYAHAGSGRLSEILDDTVLPLDRDNRLLTYRLEEQLDALAPRDRAMIEAYCAGVNDGQRMVGETPEMRIIGARWEPLTARDVLAIQRLSSWDQGEGFLEEMARYRLVKQLGDKSPVVAELMQPSRSGGVPIVNAAENGAAASAPPSPSSPSSPPPLLHGDASLEPATPSRGAGFERDAAVAARGAGFGGDARVAARGAGFGGDARVASRGAGFGGDARVASRGVGFEARAALTSAVVAMFSRGGTGASNSWSVGPEHTAKHVAVLANDPHLAHYAPGLFYMADLETPGFTAAGGTFPGVPGVLIGHGKHVAWGVTNAYADTEDVVVIQRSGDDGYLLDGQTVPFKHVTQKFHVGKRVVEEDWKSTVFGPVLPKGFGTYKLGTPFIDGSEDLVLMWTAWAFPHENARSFTGFWDLAASESVDEATVHIQDAFASPAMNFNLAFTDGTIAYRLSGLLPVRGDDQRVDFPRRGITRAAGWVGVLPAAQKPSLTRPKAGYIVAANQRVVEAAPAAFGVEANRPWRALRIDKRLRALIADNNAATDDIFAIQQDVTAQNAIELAPIIGAHCPKHIDGYDDELVRRFCAAVAHFNGDYGKDGQALPFSRTEHELVLAAFSAVHIDEALAHVLSSETWSQEALHTSLLRAGAGEKTALFADGLDGVVASAVKNALALVVAEAGPADADWRWGKLHTLTLRGPLAPMPVAGKLFETAPVEEGGNWTVPRAESPGFDQRMEVVEGAGLRMIAEMTDPPTVRMINDSGESGWFGSPHMTDQNALWHDGKARVIALPWELADKVATGRLTVKPRVLSADRPRK